MIVLAHAWEPDIAAIKNEYGPKGAVVLLVPNQSVIDRYSPSGKTTLSLVRYGRIAKQGTESAALSAMLGSAQEASR